MLASELIKRLESAIETNGDLVVVSTGYYNDKEVKDVEVFEVAILQHTESAQGWGYVENGEKAFRLLPGSFP